MDAGQPRNEEVNWNDFDAKSYLRHNYRTLRGDDRNFIIATRDHFTAHPPRPGAIGVDLGTGANLYPAFTMLPFVEKLTLLDRSVSNVRWIAGQLCFYDRSWDPFWQVLCENAIYRRIMDPRAAFRRAGSVLLRDLYTFEPEVQYDIGTMFFVAESISADWEEFKLALERFLTLLKPGAPLASAFMENSRGYQVAGKPFPAVRVDRDDITRLLSPVVEGLSVHYEPAATEDGSLREGYDGMILAVGRKKV
ncbi:SCO2525 family SAM-dependent methyltransferase [Cryptosporangium minutisporangium]|uniref:SCO2525 family SAM-dependent methyltransferase n=1 Tax=Cryptosporangium minutisporangium TaxID=113569 RepID=A0ABP6TAF6_9ACTN